MRTSEEGLHQCFAAEYGEEVAKARGRNRQFTFSWMKGRRVISHRKRQKVDGGIRFDGDPTIIDKLIQKQIICWRRLWTISNYKTVRRAVLKRKRKHAYKRVRERVRQLKVSENREHSNNIENSKYDQRMYDCISLNSWSKTTTSCGMLISSIKIRRYHTNGGRWAQPRRTRRYQRKKRWAMAWR